MEKKFEFKREQWILVRKKKANYDRSEVCKWDAYIYMYENKQYIYSLGGYPIDKDFNYIIPYENNEHLLGTTDNYEEPFEPKEGDFVVMEAKDWGYKWICIYRSISEKVETYVSLDIDSDGLDTEVIFDGDTKIKQATEEEKQRLLDALHEQGKDWDAEKCEVVDYKWMPKEGEGYYRPMMSEAELIVRYKTSFQPYENKYLNKGWVFKTEEECQALCDKLNEAIKDIK